MWSYLLPYGLQGKIKNLGPENCPWVMQNIYSLNRFYLTLPHNNSWSLDNIKNNIYAFLIIYDFSSFLADLN